LRAWPQAAAPPILGRAVAFPDRTIFPAPDAQLDPSLLLHEVAHVHQFQHVTGFPALYLWENLRCGYQANRFEREDDA